MAKPGCKPRPLVHGTKQAYDYWKCRCRRCKKAMSDYQYARRGGLVDAGPTRRHLEKLAKAHVGRYVVADAAGMSPNTVQEIRSGKTKRIFPATEKKILAVTQDVRGDHSWVPAGPTLRLLDKLLTQGFTGRSLARRLGSKAAAPWLTFYKHDQVLAKTELKVKLFYDRINAI